jgi:diaminohydroxyphosphoribosylaminopyrimidine deaminase/5-amino-6-(5-phosphoribosylamino)uracil reductase
MTNVLIEGGGGVLGSGFDAGMIDEVHVFLAPKLVGGAAAITPMAGIGLDQIPSFENITELEVQQLESDLYLHGRVVYQASECDGSVEPKSV